MLLSTVLLIQQKWGNKSAEKFIEKTYAVLDTIAQQPYILKLTRATMFEKG